MLPAAAVYRAFPSAAVEYLSGTFIAAGANLFFIAVTIKAVRTAYAYIVHKSSSFTE